MTQNDLKGFRFRESTRAPFETEVKLRFDRFGGAVSGFSADISMEGMFVRTSEPKPVGTLVQFEFGLGAEGELIQGLGDVVWVRTRQLAPNKPPGMGIQFRYIDPHSRELIFKIVDKYLKETKQEGVPAAAEAPPPTPEEAGSAAATGSPPPASAPATTPPPAAAPASPAPSVSLPPPAGQPEQVVPAPSEAPIPPPSSPIAPSAESAGGVTTGPPPAATSEPSPHASAGPATPAGAPGGAAEPSAPSVGDEAFSFAIPSLESEEGESISSPPPSPASPPRPAGGRGELFVPDEMWDPVSAAAQAVAAEPLAGPPSRPSYAGGAGVARQSSGSRRWLVVALLVLVVAAAAFLFRDRWLDLIPGAGEPVREAPAAPDLDQEAEASGADALPVAEETTPTNASEASEAPGEEEQLGDGDTSTDASAAAQLAPNAPNAPTAPQEVQQAVGAAPIRVEEIRSWQRAGETLVTIEGDGTFREGDYSELRLERPPRLLVKLFGIEEEYLALTPVASPELRQIRTALHGGNELHVVLDLAAGDVRSTVTLEGGRLRIRLER